MRHRQPSPTVPPAEPQAWAPEAPVYHPDAARGPTANEPTRCHPGMCRRPKSTRLHRQRPRKLTCCCHRPTRFSRRVQERLRRLTPHRMRPHASQSSPLGRCGSTAASPSGRTGDPRCTGSACCAGGAGRGRDPSRSSGAGRVLDRGSPRRRGDRGAAPAPRRPLGRLFTRTCRTGPSAPGHPQSARPTSSMGPRSGTGHGPSTGHGPTRHGLSPGTAPDSASGAGRVLDRGSPRRRGDRGAAPAAPRVRLPGAPLPHAGCADDDRRPRARSGHAPASARVLCRRSRVGDRHSRTRCHRAAFVRQRPAAPARRLRALANGEPHERAAPACGLFGC